MEPQSQSSRSNLCEQSRGSAHEDHAQREQHMADTTKIKEHMEVLGSDGQHVGTVDKIEGQRLKLTKSDPAAPGDHRYIHFDSVASVDTSVHLNRTAAQARDEWGVAKV